MSASREVTLTCHCQSVELRVVIRDEFASAKRCDCSYCRRRGAMTTDVALKDLKVIRQDTLGSYAFGPKSETHYFCTTCGVYTHHRRPAEGKEWGVNVGGLHGVNPRDFDPVPWVDGTTWQPELNETRAG